MDLPKKPLPNVRLRRLAAELTALREAAGLDIMDVGNRIALHRTSLSKIESGSARPQPRTLAALLNLYGVDEAKRAELQALAKPSSERAWFHAYVEALPESYGAYLSFESDAAVLHAYESLFVPGLLQTTEYARAVISEGLPGATKDAVDRRVQVRAQRQTLLAAAEPLRLQAVIDEAAIRRVVGGRETMVAQLRALGTSMDRPNVDLRVIPYSAGAHAGMAGSFTVMEFRDPAAAPLVYIDSSAGDLFLDDSTAFRRYLSTFERLQQLALGPEASARLIADAARKIK